jgi:hypothetical protein
MALCVEPGEMMSAIHDHDRDFLMFLRKELAEGVKVHDVYSIGEMIKSDHIPKGVFL